MTAVEVFGCAVYGLSTALLVAEFFAGRRPAVMAIASLLQTAGALVADLRIGAYVAVLNGWPFLNELATPTGADS